MKKSILTVMIILFLTSCSSLPKDTMDRGVMDKKEQAASVLEHGNSEYLWENHSSSANQYELAFRLSASVDWQEGMVRALIALSRSSDAMGEPENASVFLDRAFYILDEVDDRGLELSAANRQTEWLLFNASPDEALRESDRHIGAADKSPGREAGETWRIRAAILKRRGEYEGALKAADEALRLDEKKGFLREAASDHYIRASILSLSGKRDLAADEMLKALNLDKQIENTPAIAQDLYALGLIYDKSGDPRKAEHYFRRSVLVYESSGGLNIPEGLLRQLKKGGDGLLWDNSAEF